MQACLMEHQGVFLYEDGAENELLGLWMLKQGHSSRQAVVQQRDYSRVVILTRAKAALMLVLTSSVASPTS